MKTSHKLIAVGIIAGLIFWGGCEVGMKRFITKNTFTDTAVNETNLNIVYLPFPVSVNSGGKTYAKRPESPQDQRETDTVWMDGEPVTVYLPAETPDWAVEMLNEYDSLRTYDTTISYDRGSIRLIDSVNFNRLTGRRVVLNAVDTVIKSSVVHEKKKNFVLSLTASAGINPGFANPSGAVGIQATTPGNKTYQIEYQRVSGIKGPLIMVTVGLPIRFNINPLKRK